MEPRPPCPRHRLPAFAHPPAELILEEAVSSLLSTVEIDLLLPRIAALLRRYFGSTRVCLCRRLHDAPDWGEVLLVDDPKGLANEPAPGTRFPLSGSLVGEAIRRGEPVALERLDAQQPRFAEEGRLAAAGFGSLACFPLIADGAALGTLEIAHGPREGLLSRCFVHAERIARLVAIALQNGLLVAEVRRLNGLLKREMFLGLGE